MKTETLKELGLTDEQIAGVMKENGKDVNKLQKEVETLKADKDDLAEQLKVANESLESFKDINPDELQQKVKDAEARAKQAEDKYNSKLAEREKADLLKEAFADIEFTSESAKKAIMKDISDSVTVKNGKLIGFNDLLEEAKSNDASAFVDKAQKDLEQNKAKFTTQMGGKQTGTTKTKEEIMAIQDRGERRKAMLENSELFPQLSE